MSRWVTRPDQDRLALELWWNGVRAVWERQPGLVHVHLLARRDSRDRMTLSVWRTEEDYLRFRTSDDLARVAQSFDEVYDHDGWPQAEDWSVLSEDWPVA